MVAYGSSPSGEFGVTGDFNGDGRFDIIGSGQFASGIAFLPGRGDGSFGERSIFALDEAPADGVSGDFNHDGNLDLATTNFFGAPDYSVSIHLGRGDGTFDDPAHYGVGESPLGIVSGDFNNDGHLDLVNANFRSDPPSLSLLLGRGDGTFASDVRIETGLLPDFLLTRDFDGDSNLDLIVSNAGSTDVAVHVGRGDGTFADPVFYPIGDGPTPRRGLESADFNGDGQLDLAIPQVLSSDVTVLLGMEDGSFAGPLRFPVGLGPAAIATGDYSGDGRPDIASVNPNTNELTISLGAAGATLRNPQRYVVGIAPVALAQGDFNRDGRLDVAVANQGSGDLSILLGLGTGALRDETRVPVGDQPVAVVAGDYNGDSFVDLVAANAGSSDVSILLGRGDGTFRGRCVWRPVIFRSRWPRATSMATAISTWRPPTTVRRMCRSISAKATALFQCRSGFRSARPRCFCWQAIWTATAGSIWRRPIRCRTTYLCCGGAAAAGLTAP
jgi:hypothetical protein